MAAKSWLSSATNKPPDRPAAVVIGGQPGIGKSSLAGNIPGMLAIPIGSENTWPQLKSIGAVPADLPVIPEPPQTYEQVHELLAELATAEHSYKGVIIDTVNVVEKLCQLHVCLRDFKGDMGPQGFNNYGKGYDASASEWKTFINALDRVRTRGLRVILLAHVKVKTFTNPLGADYDRYILDLHEKVLAITNGWADAVLFANYFVAVDEKGKGKGGRDRFLYTEYSPAYDAKNRFNLPAEIPMGKSGAEGWKNLSDAIKGGRKKEAA